MKMFSDQENYERTDQVQAQIIIDPKGKDRRFLFCGSLAEMYDKARFRWSKSSLFITKL